MLSVRYAPHVPAALIELVEHHARPLGISLDALEMIGQSLDFVEGFIVAAEEGRAEAFAAQFHQAARVARVERARAQAAVLF